MKTEHQPELPDGKPVVKLPKFMADEANICHGLVLAIEEIQKLEKKYSLPGMALARQAIAAELTHTKVRVTMESVPVAAKAGVDLSKWAVAGFHGEATKENGREFFISFEPIGQ